MSAPRLHTVELQLPPHARADALSLGSQHAGKPSELTVDDIQAIMKAHNDVRARYGVPALQWDTGLADIAKQWADACYWGHWKADRTKEALGAEYFPPPRTLGENLSVWRDDRSTALAGQYGTQLWLNEEKDFDCQTGQCIPGRMCGHWTQMLWSTTQRVGCALRTCPDGIHPKSWTTGVAGVPNVKYLVCQYEGPGNYANERPFPLASCSQPGLRQPRTEAPPPAVVEKDQITEKNNNTNATSDSETRFRVRRTPVQPGVTPAVGEYGLGPDLEPVGGQEAPSAPTGAPTPDYGLGPELVDGTSDAPPGGAAPQLSGPPAGAQQPTRGFVPRGVTLYKLNDPKVVKTPPSTNDNKKNNEIAAPSRVIANNAVAVPNNTANDTNAKSIDEPLPPPPEPPLDASAPPAAGVNTLLASGGGSLVGALVLGVIVGFLIYYVQVQQHATPKGSTNFETSRVNSRQI